MVDPTLVDSALVSEVGEVVDVGVVPVVDVGVVPVDEAF